MRFGYTILYVRDVAASLDLYERAFGQKRRLLHASGEYAELDTGATTLAFASRALAESNVPGAFGPERAEGASGAGTPGPPRAAFEVCFVTEDVEAAFERAVREGAEPVTAPQTKPWGQAVAYVRDLDGNLVELASPAS
jgi:lactoylglutathione lyase